MPPFLQHLWPHVLPLISVRGKKTLYFKVCFLPDGKRKKKQKTGTLCTDTVLVAHVWASVLQKQSGSCSTVLSVQFIYFILCVSEVYNLSADALWSSPTAPFSVVGMFLLLPHHGCTALNCMKRASCVSQSLDNQYCKHQSVLDWYAINVSGGFNRGESSIHCRDAG